MLGGECGDDEVSSSDDSPVSLKILYIQRGVPR